MFPFTPSDEPELLLPSDVQMSLWLLRVPLCSECFHAHTCEGMKTCRLKKLIILERVKMGGVFMQHPREASRLRLVLLNMERGHTAKAAGSFWLAANVAIQAGIGGADAARHHVVGTKPFWTEAKQRGTDLKTHTHTCAYTLSDTHALKRKYACNWICICAW